jgi:hypothetical protein
MVENPGYLTNYHIQLWLRLFCTTLLQIALQRKFQDIKVDNIKIYSLQIGMNLSQAGVVSRDMVQASAQHKYVVVSLVYRG